MKRRFANSVNKGKNKFIQRRVVEDYFKGYVCKVTVNKVTKPIVVNSKGEELVLLGDDYVWYMAYPDNEKYALTIMYDNKFNLIEWYFDIAKRLGIKNGIPYEDDMYLDLVIKPDGTVELLDEDELKDALDKDIITKEDYDEAYLTVNKLIDKYQKNIDELLELTQKIKSEF